MCLYHIQTRHDYDFLLHFPHEFLMSFIIVVIVIVVVNDVVVVILLLLL